MKKDTFRILLAVLLAGATAAAVLSASLAAAADPGAPSSAPSGTAVPVVEVLHHEWRPDVVWKRIGKTKFIWSATVRNNSDKRQRVFVYYDLLDDRGVPLARNVFDRFVPPHQTAEIKADSYIMSVDLPFVRSSRARVKTRFPR